MLEVINLLQTTYLDPGIVSAESSLCATIHWGYTCVFWFVHTCTRLPLWKNCNWKVVAYLCLQPQQILDHLAAGLYWLCCIGFPHPACLKFALLSYCFGLTLPWIALCALPTLRFALDLSCVDLALLCVSLAYLCFALGSTWRCFAFTFICLFQLLFE